MTRNRRILFPEVSMTRNRKALSLEEELEQ